jgi:hypothetical protein
MSLEVGAGLGTSRTAPDPPECVSRWLLEHKDMIKEFMLRNGYERFYRFDLLQPISHPRGYCKDDKALRDAVAIREIITTEGSSALAVLFKYYVNALYDPIISSRNRREFKENVGFLKRFLHEYEKEYQGRMREARAEVALPSL